MAYCRLILTLAVATVALTMIGSASAETIACKAATAADNKCEATLNQGDVFTMDCTSSGDLFNPPDMSALLSSKVCSHSTKWTKADTVCDAADQVTQVGLATKGVIVAYVLGTLTITNDKAAGTQLLNGSCLNSAKDKSSYFNVTVSSAYSGLHASFAIVLAMIAAGVLSASSL